MKVIFIKNIETEVKDLDHIEQNFVMEECVPMQHAVIFEGQAPRIASMTVKREVYNLVRICQGKGQIENYYVKRDEKDLFMDLATISAHIVEVLIAKKCEVLKLQCKESIEITIFETKNNIKNLPWWKRLFNQF